jgi:hypothetical protein
MRIARQAGREAKQEYENELWGKEKLGKVYYKEKREVKRIVEAYGRKGGKRRRDTVGEKREKVRGGQKQRKRKKKGPMSGAQRRNRKGNEEEKQNRKNSR